MEIICKNIKDTENLAFTFSKYVKDEGAFITLRGEIGAGKTAFSRFLLKAIGVKQSITSPTFVILNEYHSDDHISAYHFDLYRLENSGLKTIMPEIEEYSSGNNLTLVEWADFGKEALPKERLDIMISCNKKNEESRVFEIKAYGQKAENILKNIEQEYEVKNAAPCI